MSDDLRAALGAKPDPEFTMMLPDGWVRMDASDASRDAVLAAAKARLMTAHRPDLWATTRSTIQQAFENLRKNRGVAIMMQLESDEDRPFIPASLTAAIQTAPVGVGMDDYVAHLIGDGATPLGDDKRFVRQEKREEVTQDGVRIGLTTVRYLTPVPGTKRSRALLLTAVMPHETTTPDDDPLLTAVRFTIDAHVSTLRWMPAGARAAGARP
ncbi:hypothetical protein [Agromyces archimandritae]|uniref:Uncharacterized protein n=1 Tax=Agromyces archimandritae TaxID=2781962 RepID=A0A975FP98_9MICO|nr:hypothetical protein [Agromyces archimandritae]QTX05519.1 hypothetical protein G127AT_04695 [Agromyces archimandritae]